MNEFQSMLKEAFAGEEPYDLYPGRDELENALRGFERREKVLRWMLWFSVVFMSAVCVLSVWRFWSIESGADPKSMILWATLFLFASNAIGWSKIFLFLSQQHWSAMKDLKRLHLELLGREVKG